MLDKNLQLSIIANDILKTQKPVYTSYSNGIKTMYRNYYDTQFLPYPYLISLEIKNLKFQNIILETRKKKTEQENKLLNDSFCKCTVQKTIINR
jgi:hypothetical protein